ncbi:MAG: thymidine phosphorylase, partial [Armatimonadetes bacterium]|nr:thymidine phosphorylase [Armatimonadota bacterium]
MSIGIRRLSARKRRGGELTAEELRWVVQSYTAGEIDDAPMAAWLMAVCCGGMTEAEAWAMTEAMTDSGRRLDLSGLSRPTVDKHSTGGVGDKVTLIACPIAAACGACVAKMSGRGLWHTGGTIDRLEAVPGLSCEMTPGKFLEQAEEVGLVVASQSADLAPADGKIYALRDATGTVDNPGLIAASIMSKKLAAGAEAIVLDVTVGSGAFISELDAARELAGLMVGIGRRAGRIMAAVLTDMNQPLGEKIGNALEVEEALWSPRRSRRPDLRRR